MRIFTVFNHKGGCGKTTTAINLAAALAEAGRRTLLVDLDPQAHATVGCGVREEEIELSTWDVLRGAEQEELLLAMPDVAWEIFDNLYLAPSDVALATLEQTLAGAPGRDQRLRRVLAASAERYDVAVIDCGPGLGLLATNALVAATDIIMPVDLGFFSVYGLRRAVATVDMIAERTGREPNVHVLATLYDARTKTMRRSLANLREKYGPLVLETVIRFNVALREAAAVGSPIVEFRAGCRGHEDYRALADELATGDLEAALQIETAAEAEADREAEKKLDEKIQEVYGAIPFDGGVRFVCHAPGADRVRVAGDFNQWDTNGESDMQPGEADGVWTKEFRLPPGRYAYRLIIDDRWCSDPANPYVESNPFGEVNSVVEVK